MIKWLLHFAQFNGFSNVSWSQSWETISGIAIKLGHFITISLFSMLKMRKITSKNQKTELCRIDSWPDLLPKHSSLERESCHIRFQIRFPILCLLHSIGRVLWPNLCPFLIRLKWIVVNRIENYEWKKLISLKINLLTNLTKDFLSLELNLEFFPRLV